jgi:hypothetical protein
MEGPVRQVIYWLAATVIGARRICALPMQRIETVTTSRK